MTGPEDVRGDRVGLTDADSSDMWSQRLHEPLPRRTLSPGIIALLWVLRVYVMVAVPIVVYAFFRALNPGH
jgi:hypothetical protein